MNCIVFSSTVVFPGHLLSVGKVLASVLSRWNSVDRFAIDFILQIPATDAYIACSFSRHRTTLATGALPAEFRCARICTYK